MAEIKSWRALKCSVSCRCIKNYHKFNGLKWHPFVDEKFGQAQPCFLFRVSQGSNEDIYQAGCLSRGSGEESSSKLTWLPRAGRIQFHAVVGPRSPFLYWPFGLGLLSAPRGHSLVFVCGFFSLQRQQCGPESFTCFEFP